MELIGRGLVGALLRAGWQVTVLTRRGVKSEFPGPVSVVRADLTRGDADVRPLLEGCDVLFHCAGELYRPEAMEALHVGGTERLLAAEQALAATRKKPLHWINLSSVGAYGPPTSGPSEPRIVTEDYRCVPVGPYETTKTKSDELVFDAGRKGIIDYTIVRPTNVFGEAMTNQSLRGLLSAIRRRLFFYIGAPGAIANYIHVDDVVDALIACADGGPALNQVFNVSNDCLLEELVVECAHEFGVPAEPAHPGTASEANGESG